MKTNSFLILANSLILSNKQILQIKKNKNSISETKHKIAKSIISPNKIIYFLIISQRIITISQAINPIEKPKNITPATDKALNITRSPSKNNR